MCRSVVCCYDANVELNMAAVVMAPPSAQGGRVKDPSSRDTLDYNL